MYKLFSLAFLAGLLMAGLVAAAPANELKPRWAMPGKQLSKRSYRIDRVAVSTGGQRSAVKAAVKAYNKYNIPVPAALKDAHAALRQAEALILKDGHKKKKGGKAAKGSKGSKGSKGGAGSASGNGTAAAGSASPTTGAGSLSGNGTAGVGAAASTGAAGAQAGTVAATPEANDVEFLAPITVGGQTMNMDFDTGSSDLYDCSCLTSATNPFMLIDSLIGGSSVPHSQQQTSRVIKSSTQPSHPRSSQSMVPHSPLALVTGPPHKVTLSAQTP